MVVTKEPPITPRPEVVTDRAAISGWPTGFIVPGIPRAWRGIVNPMDLAIARGMPDPLAALAQMGYTDLPMPTPEPQQVRPTGHRPASAPGFAAVQTLTPQWAEDFADAERLRTSTGDADALSERSPRPKSGRSAPEDPMDEKPALRPEIAALRANYRQDPNRPSRTPEGSRLARAKQAVRKGRFASITEALRLMPTRRRRDT